MHALKLLTVSIAIMGSVTSAYAETYVQKSFVEGLVGDLAPSINVLSNNFEFSDTYVGNSSSLTVVVKNPSLTYNLTDLRTILDTSVFNISSNTCGTIEAPVTLIAGHTCSVTITFNPLVAGDYTGTVLFDSAASASGPQSRLLTASGLANTAENIVDATTDDLVFSAVQGDTVLKTLAYTNQGTGASALTYLTLDDPNGVMSLVSNNCGTAAAKTAVNPSSSCTSGLSISSLELGTYSGQVTITSGSSGQYSIVKQIQATINPAIAYLFANPNPVDFGNVPDGQYTTQVITVSNTGGFVPASGLYLTPPSAVAGFSILANDCGTQASPASIPPDGSCNVTVQYGGSEPTSIKGKSLTFTSPAVDEPLVVPLTGTAAGFDVDFYYYNLLTDFYNIASSNAGMGIQTVNGTFYGRVNGSSPTTSFYVKNIMTKGAMNVGFTLSGNTNQFHVESVSLANSAGSATIPCPQSANSTEFLMYSCTANPVQNGDNASNMPHLKVTVRYTPTEESDWWDHRLVMTPFTDNGSNMYPDPMTIVGQARFYNVLNWSTAYNNQTDPTAAYLQYISRPVGSTTNKVIYLRALGNSNGKNSASFTLSGDVSQFQITSVKKAYSGTNVASNYVDCGVTITSTSISECFLNDRINGDTLANLPNMHLVVAYKPTVVGNHTLTITPSSTIGTMSGPNMSVGGTDPRYPMPSVTFSASSY